MKSCLADIQGNLESTFQRRVSGWSTEGVEPAAEGGPHNGNCGGGVDSSRLDQGLGGSIGGRVLDWAAGPPRTESGRQSPRPILRPPLSRPSRRWVGAEGEMEELGEPGRELVGALADAGVAGVGLAGERAAVVRAAFPTR